MQYERDHRLWLHRQRHGIAFLSPARYSPGRVRHPAVRSARRSFLQCATLSLLGLLGTIRFIALPAQRAGRGLRMEFFLWQQLPGYKPGGECPLCCRVLSGEFRWTTSPQPATFSIPPSQLISVVSEFFLTQDWHTLIYGQFESKPENAIRV